ncbi:SH3D19 [Branchiostoma lanceolatum]|uniref:SH3D19 protein n=1 Tax=Branchiostoma lanceolatum TaxID=7740 RepID=A0A8J9VM34_BRALA|nr:SH3D19 [Branchiostoma lanceolatum]
MAALGRAQLVGQASLRIDRTTADDEGMYALSIMTDERGTDEKFIRLDLHVPPKLEVGPSNPYITTWGKTVSLMCIVRDAKPNITSLHWEKDGGRIEANGYKGKYSGGNAKSPSLVIRRVTRADAGLYTCFVQHPVRPAAESMLVRVQCIQKEITATALAIVIGATAGGLWFLICICLLGYVLRRRRKQEERKKFAFYYDIGSRRDPAEPCTKEGQDLRRHSALPERRYARAMYDYKPRDDNELRLEAGDVIEVLEGEAGDWCLGFTAGRVGLFPSNYVIFISASEAAEDDHTYNVLAESEKRPTPKV